LCRARLQLIVSRSPAVDCVALACNSPLTSLHSLTSLLLLLHPTTTGLSDLRAFAAGHPDAEHHGGSEVQPGDADAGMGRAGKREGDDVRGRVQAAERAAVPGGGTYFLERYPLCWGWGDTHVTPVFLRGGRERSDRPPLPRRSPFSVLCHPLTIGHHHPLK